MADERFRDLERKARRGDPDAERQLYWERLRLGGSELLDRVIERVMALERGPSGSAPTVADKIAWISGSDDSARRETPVVGTRDPEMVMSALIRWSSIDRARDLRNIPAHLPFNGMGVYVAREQAAYRWVQGAEASWEHVCHMGAPPPGLPFFVVDTMQARDALPHTLIRQGASCLVLETMVLYRASSWREHGPQRVVWSWDSFRIERRA